jgi:glycosyltransferase involved in cell wall biosynthesis
MSRIIAYISKKINGTIFIFEVNGIISEEQELMRNESSIRNNNIFIKTILKFRNYKEIFMMKRADAVIAVTSGIKEYLCQHGLDKDKIWVIGNGANTDVFKPMDQNTVRNELGLKTGYHYVCFAGNLAPWQGVEYLIQAVPFILKTCPNTRFLIIGDGIMMSDWVQLTHKLEISDKFIFTGNIHYRMVPLYINVSDICIVTKRPLRSGYSPLKLYEYMACGKPIIATRTYGFEILEEYKAGILLDPTNTHELADAVIKLLQNEDIRKQMGNNGYNNAVKKHGWASVARNVADVCENLITEQKNKLEHSRHN